MPDITTLIESFYDFLVIGVTDYLFVFDVHFIIAFIVIIIGVKYTDNLNWYRDIYGRNKRYCLPITGIFILIGYLIEAHLSEGITSDIIFSLLQSYMLSLVFQDVFAVLIGFLIFKLTFGYVKFDHKNRSINYLNTKKTTDQIELDSGNHDD